MGARGSCNACSHPRRDAINAAKADGMPVATIGRTFNVAATTLVRHFRNGHARPAPKAAPAPAARPAPVSAPSPRHPKASDPDPEVSFAKVKQAAVFLGVPFGELAACLENHLELTVTTATPEEEDELFAAWDEADDCDEYVASIVRNGTFYTETAGR